ncbi:LysR family transcriptional regulator [Variovorax sp. HJSM1_2]|uniref:LysR family transcriptional regulator n=1 Tax=Variovorax sp. HJSM1_2 TaxID=3366263 RepID=UPI003BE670A1
MRLATLQALVAAVEEGSLRGASRRVGASQPALSKMIRELELELAVPLLMRTSRGVIPTEQGKVLYEHAVKVSRELVSAVDTIQQLGGQMVGQLHVGAVPLAVMLLIPETLRTFGQAFPNIRLRISEELYIAQLQRLRAGEVDLMVGGVPDDLSRGEFTIERLTHTEMVPTARHGSPWLKARTMADLQQAKWVYTGANAESGYARQWYEQHALPSPRVGAVVNSTLALLSLVAAGDCVALMPRQIALQPIMQAHLSIINVHERGLPLEVGVMVRSDAAMSPAIRQFIAHLHRAAHQLDVASAAVQAKG